jgi:hypothetical protein
MFQRLGNLPATQFTCQRLGVRRMGCGGGFLESSPEVTRATVRLGALCAEETHDSRIVLHIRAEIAAKNLIAALARDLPYQFVTSLGQTVTYCRGNLK